MKVYVVLGEAPMGSELLAVCSTKEKAINKIFEELKGEFTEEELEGQLRERGLSSFLYDYGYDILECEIDGECREVE